MSQQGKKADGGLKQIMNVRLEKMDALRERGIELTDPPAPGEIIEN